MKLIICFASIMVLFGTTGCIVPVRERTYVQRQEYPRHHHWEHKGVHHYYYYER
jgi:hypothetical protein